jgi:glutathione synthase
MAVRLAMVMDPIGDINVKKDTSFAILLEAQRRGHQLAYLELGDLYLRDGAVHCRWRELSVTDDPRHWFEFGKEYFSPCDVFDLLLMRKDPPFDTEYVFATYLLEFVERAGVLVVNKPQALRDVNEKMFTGWFPQCCPPTLVTRDGAALRKFVVEQKDAVIKPLHAMGGAMVFRVSSTDPNLGVVIETLTAHGDRYAMAQRYLPEISAGDKRILLIDGQPIDYALARIPAPGETRGNLAAGGRGEGVELSDRDRWICAEVGDALRARGLYFVGLDVIGDYLTEINVTSPTCVRELEAQYGINICGRLLDRLEEALPATRPSDLY